MACEEYNIVSAFVKKNSVSSIYSIKASFETSKNLLGEIYSTYSQNKKADSRLKFSIILVF